MTPSFAFAHAVATVRDLVVTRAGEHVCRLEPRDSSVPWYCDLDDGTPTGENDPASFVRWVCPSLRDRRVGTEPPQPTVEVRRRGPQSDLGRLMAGFGRLSGRGSRRDPDAEGALVYTDPVGVLDASLRQRLESWPAARHGDGVVRPAQLQSVACTGEGLVVESVSWWDSAPAHDHQIQLGIDIADRLTAPALPRRRLPARRADGGSDDQSG